MFKFPDRGSPTTSTTAALEELIPPLTTLEKFETSRGRVINRTGH